MGREGKRQGNREGKKVPPVLGTVQKALHFSTSVCSQVLIVTAE